VSGSEGPPHGGDPHRWFRARLDANASGLLTEPEQERFDRHAAECERCRRAAEVHAANLPEADFSGHLPPGLLARWDRAATALRGVERKLVREHLENCAECRDDLRRLGFEPRLASEPEPARAARRPLAEVTPIGSRLRDWVMGGAVGALAAVAAALLIVPGVGRREPEPPSIPAPSREPAYRLEILAPAPDLPAFDDAPRSGGAAPARDVTLHITPETRFVQFPTPTLFSGSSALIEVVGPDGRVLATERRDRRELGARHRILFGRADRALETGRYVLRITVAPEAGSSLAPESLAAGFVLEHRPHR